MSVTQCRFCDHVNAAASKFCSECGGALHLLPCPRCGAVSQVTATVCYQCQAKLPWHRAEMPIGASPSAVVSKPSIRWRSPAVVSAAVVAAIAILGYYGYRQVSLADTPQLPAAGTAGSGSAPRADGVGKGPNGEVSDATGQASESTEISSTVPATATAMKSRRSYHPAQSPDATAAVEPVERSATVSVGKIAPRTPSGLEACTTPVAALGLCTLKPGQAKEAGTAAITARSASVESLDATKIGAEDSSRGESCPEAEAALGLCTPRISQGGN
jgi:hypothetical protein